MGVSLGLTSVGNRFGTGSAVICAIRKQAVPKSSEKTRRTFYPTESFARDQLMVNRDVEDQNISPACGEVMEAF